MLASKDCLAFAQALAYWNTGDHLDEVARLVSPEGVVETRTSLAQLVGDLGESVQMETPAGWLHFWPNIRSCGRTGILFAMDFGESRAVHFAFFSGTRQ